MAKNKQKNTKKRTIAVVAAALACLIIGGVVAAYYSDLFEDNGTVVAGNLSISVDHEVLLNDTPTTLSSITSLNPGDIIVIRGTVTNEGTQSAWVREAISFTPTSSVLVPYIHVYSGEISQASLLADTDHTASELALTDGMAVSANKVLDGNTAEGGGGFNYVGTSYNFALTIYFHKDAGNDTQNANVLLSFVTQALQFANNNASEPLETAWATVFAR